MWSQSQLPITSERLDRLKGASEPQKIQAKKKIPEWPETSRLILMFLRWSQPEGFTNQLERRGGEIDARKQELKRTMSVADSGKRATT